MKKSRLLATISVVAMLVALTVQGVGAAGQEVVEKVATHGRINWSQAIVYAKGIGPAPDKPSEKTQKATPGRKAEAEAYSNLLKTINRVRVDSLTLVKDIVGRGEMVRSQFQQMVKDSKVVKREYLSDGMVEVTLAFNLTGGFAQLALPRDIMPVPEIKTIPKAPAKGQKPEQGPKPSNPTPPSIVYTGLVLDARGLKCRPAMSPRIANENGDEVYGSVYASREFAVQNGMAVYVRDLKAARNSSRVSNNPLTVRALRTVGPGQCDFVVSNADASKIRSASENLMFLKKCKVVVVLD